LPSQVHSRTRWFPWSTLFLNPHIAWYRKSKPVRVSTPINVVSDEPETGSDLVHVARETLPSAEDSKVNKSEVIRVEARRIMKDGGMPRPKIIVENLARRGIDAAPPQVRQVLKKMGVAQRPRRKKGPDPPTASIATHKPATGDSVTLHELLAAKQFAKMIGDPFRAKSLLDALDKLS
jgi:hypothetical protein